MINLIDLVKGVTEGLYNSVVLNEAIEEMAQERLSKCINCPFNSTPGKIVNISKCKGCGCFLKLKSRVPTATCGLKEYNQNHPDDQREIQWFPATDNETENKINELI